MSNTSSTDSDSGKVAEVETVEIFTGISQTLFALGVSGFRSFADAWESEILAHTDDSIDKVVKSLEGEREAYDKTFGESLEKIDKADFDAQAILFRNRAVYHKALDEKIAIARLIPASKAYEVVAKAHGLPYRKPSGNSSSSVENTVWKVNRYKHERYYLITEESVSCYVVGDDSQGADLVVTVSAENYPNIYKTLTSASAIGKLHDMLYTDSTKRFPNKPARLKAMESDPAHWYNKTGRNNDTSNGVNNMSQLEDTTPEAWLKANVKEEEESE